MRRVWRIVCLSLPLLASPTWPADAGIRMLRMEEPRNFGYFVGDTFERRAELFVDGDDTLLPASLPNVGSLTYWLDLLRVDVQERHADGDRFYRITLVYQNFYVPLDAHKMTVPEWPLLVGGNTAPIPAFTFTAAPIRELFPEKSGETVGTFLQPDAQPLPISMGWLPTALGSSGAVTLLALLLLTRHHSWWPFGRRPDRPFAQAARAIASLQGADANVAYRDALIALHRAFDATDRRRVLVADVGDFIGRHPEFTTYRIRIEDFFRSSRGVFFGGVANEATALMPLQAIKSLAGELARGERTH